MAPPVRRKASIAIASTPINDIRLRATVGCPDDRPDRGVTRSVPYERRRSRRREAVRMSTPARCGGRPGTVYQRGDSQSAGDRKAACYQSVAAHVLHHFVPPVLARPRLQTLELLACVAEGGIG